MNILGPVGGSLSEAQRHLVTGNQTVRTADKRAFRRAPKYLPKPTDQDGISLDVWL